MNRRVLVAGVAVLAILAALFVAGYFLISDRNGGPSNDASPSPSPPDVRTQIEQAYLNFWDVYEEAALSLDAKGFAQVATGEALGALTSQIDQQKSKNQPVRLSVEHNYEIVYPLGGADDTASVDDHYINHSVRLDPNTKEPIEPDPKTPTHDTVTLKKVNGKWLVAEIIEHR